MVLDVERVRFSEEQKVCQLLTAYLDEKRVQAPRYDPASGRRSLRSRGLLLSEAIAPVAVRALDEAQRQLGVNVLFELYQTSQYEGSSTFVEHGNACVHFTDPPSIEAIGHYIASLDPLALTAVFGHELGHFLAHGPGSTSHPTWRRSQVAYRGEPRFHLSRELTADRFGLLACRDLAAALRVEMISIAGLAGTAMTWDTDAYLDDCRRLVEELLKLGYQASGFTHPEHSVRAYAIWLFSESDVYHAMTGQGSGHRPLAEVDAQLGALLPPFNRPAMTATSAPGPAPVIPPPAPPPLPPAPRTPPPSTVPSLRGQLDYAMKDLRGKFAAMFAPAERASPSSDDIEDIVYGDDDLEAKFAALERKLGKKAD